MNISNLAIKSIVCSIMLVACSAFAAESFTDAKGFNLEVGQKVLYKGQVVTLKSFKQTGAVIVFASIDGKATDVVMHDQALVDPIGALTTGDKIDEFPGLSEELDDLSEENPDLIVVKIQPRYRVTLKTGLFSKERFEEIGPVFSEISAQANAVATHNGEFTVGDKVFYFKSFIESEDMGTTTIRWTGKKSGTIKRLFTDGTAEINGKLFSFAETTIAHKSDAKFEGKKNVTRVVL